PAVRIGHAVHDRGVVSPLRGVLLILGDDAAVLELVLDDGGRGHQVVPDLEDVAGLDLGEIDRVAPDVIRVGPKGPKVARRAGAGLLQRFLAEIPALAAPDLVAELASRPHHDFLIGRERLALAHATLTCARRAAAGPVRRRRAGTPCRTRR